MMDFVLFPTLMQEWALGSWPVSICINLPLSHICIGLFGGSGCIIGLHRTWRWVKPLFWGFVHFKGRREGEREMKREAERVKQTYKEENKSEWNITDQSLGWVLGLEKLNTFTVIYSWTFRLCGGLGMSKVNITQAEWILFLIQKLTSTSAREASWRWARPLQWSESCNSWEQLPIF